MYRRIDFAVLEENHFNWLMWNLSKKPVPGIFVPTLTRKAGITIDDLTLVNHALSDKMDAEDFIDESYILEVSSPGLLRPFKKPKDYQRNLGEDVEVKLFAPITFEQKGKKYTDKEFIGILKSYEAPQEDSVNGGKIVLGFDGEEILELEIKDIALIRKSIDF